MPDVRQFVFNVATAGDGSAPAWMSALTPNVWTAVGDSIFWGNNPATFPDGTTHPDAGRPIDPAADPNINWRYDSTFAFGTDAAREKNRLSAPWSGNNGADAPFENWSGAVLAQNYGTHGTYCVHGGGDKSGVCTSVFGFDLGAQKWVRLNRPHPGENSATELWSLSIDVYGRLPSKPYPDGQICPEGHMHPAHTYNGLVYDPINKSLVNFSIVDAAQNTSSGIKPGELVQGAWAVFTLDDRTWHQGYPLDQTGDFGFGFETNRFESFAVYDPISGYPLWLGSQGAASDASRRQYPVWVDASVGGSFGGYSTRGRAVAYSAPREALIQGTGGFSGAVDENRGFVMAVRKNDPLSQYTPPRYLELPGSGISGSQTMNPSALLNVSGGFGSATEGASLMWSPKLDAFLFINYYLGLTVYKIAPPTSGDWRTATWTISQIACDTTEAVYASGQSSGYYPWNRVQIARYTDMDVLVMCNTSGSGDSISERRSGTVQVMRLN